MTCFEIFIGQRYAECLFVILYFYQQHYLHPRARSFKDYCGSSSSLSLQDMLLSLFWFCLQTSSLVIWNSEAYLNHIKSQVLQYDVPEWVAVLCLTLI
jgi:hypothetical protein